MLRGGVKDFSELKKIEGLTQRKLEVIQLYLAIAQQLRETGLPDTSGLDENIQKYKSLTASGKTLILEGIVFGFLGLVFGSGYYSTYKDRRIE